MKVFEGKARESGYRFLLFSALMSVTASCNHAIPHGVGMPTYRMPAAVVVQTPPVTLPSTVRVPTTVAHVPHQQVAASAPPVVSGGEAPVVTAVSMTPPGSTVIRQAPITVHRPAVMVNQPPVWVGSPPVPIGSPPMLVRQPPITYHQPGIVLHPPKVEFQNPTFVPPTYGYNPPPQAQLAPPAPSVVPPAVSVDPAEPDVTHYPVPVTPTLEPSRDLPPK